METKICTKCKKELPVEEFHWRDKSKGKRRSECKTCHNSFMKEKYQDKKQTFEQMKSEQSCAKCGETRGYVLDYHHIDPTQKDNTIARITSNKYKIESILSEIEKCVVLCSNCHREFHHFNNINGISLEEYLL